MAKQPQFIITQSSSGGSGVTSVTATAPLASSGGATPDISIPAATGSQDGYLTSTDWTTFNNKLDPSAIVKTPNTVAGFDGSGDLESIPDWNISTVTGGANILLNLTPADSVGGQTDIIHNLQNTITPTNDLVNLNHQGLQNYTYLNGPNDFNAFIGFNNGINTADTGEKGYLTLYNGSLDLGDGTNASTSQGGNLINTYASIHNAHVVQQNINGLQATFTVDTGATAQSLNNISAYTELNGTIVNTLNLFSSGITINTAQPGVGIGVFNSGGNLNADMQYFNGINVGYNFNTGCEVINGTTVFVDNTHFNSGSISNGVVSFTANPLFDTGSTSNNGYTGFNVGASVQDGFSGKGVNAFNSTPNLNTTMDYFTAFGSFGNMGSSTVIVNGATTFNEGMQIQSGASITNYTSFGGFISFQSGSTVDNYWGLQVNPQFDGTITGDVRGIQVSPHGTASTDSLILVDISGNQLASTTQPVGLNVNNANIQLNAVYDTSLYPSSPGFLNINNVGGLLHVQSGDPISTTLTLANIVGIGVWAEDDIGPDPFVGSLGIANISMAQQMIVASGKTIDSYNHILAAVSLPAPPSGTDGGTVDDFYFLRMPGLLAQGGTLTATNMYQIYMDDIGGSSSATNAWGLFIADGNLENYIKGSVAIDTTSTKVSNASVGLELGSTTKAVRLSNLTSTERSALTPLSGMILFNTDLAKVEYYDGASWIAV